MQKPKLTIGYDCNNLPCQVYRSQLSDGSYLDIDAVLAFQSGSIKRFCETEIMAAERDMAITDAALAAELNE